MPKCDRCNRTELPTKEFEVKGGRKTRLCGSCEAKSIAAHEEGFLTPVKGSADKGIARVQSPPGDEEDAPPASPTERSSAQSPRSDESAS